MRIKKATGLKPIALLFTHPVFASLDHLLFGCGGKRVYLFFVLYRLCKAESIDQSRILGSGDKQKQR
jgi:hypothetical protein